MADIPGRLKIGSDGRVTGPASISYNNPFPCVNGSWGSGAMNGVVMHTMVGNLPGTIAVFNEPSYQASAHFGIDQQGHIHQFGPIGLGWIAWAQVAGNLAWYSIEHADNGDTENPLTDAQIAASAQLVEMLSAFADFPLQVTNSVTGRGYGTHVMGGASWGGHTCPGPGPRAAQRHSIVELAKQIRSAKPTPTWQARALASAQAIEAEATALAAVLTSGAALTQAQAIQASSASLVTLLGAHQPAAAAAPAAAVRAGTGEAAQAGEAAAGAPAQPGIPAAQGEGPAEGPAGQPGSQAGQVVAPPVPAQPSSPESADRIAPG